MMTERVCYWCRRRRRRCLLMPHEAAQRAVRIGEHAYRRFFFSNGFFSTFFFSHIFFFFLLFSMR